ncbi:MAG: 30S ribosomal protein S3 [Candidatus Andersenbacteria bacterium]|nr:30S ribosomal protein S3 [bacterium]MDZ4225750.1 30S ribosomal protein S3 [Candidatus Andersenbacteria bacterium]
MGRKTNPNIIRISNTLRSWDPKWFADRRHIYRRQLRQDLLIREYLRKELRSASISRVEIARDQKETVLTIHTSRPAVVIGRGGSGIEKIQKDLTRKFGPTGKIRINVQEIRNPDTDSAAVATQIVDQLERRMPFRRVLKQSVSRAMQAGAVGVRVALSGRLNGAEIARREWLAEGNVPLHTFRADISYAQMTAYTTYGTIGVKVWINRGEYKVENEEKPGKSIEPSKVTSRRHRKSLADKAVETKVEVNE